MKLEFKPGWATDVKLKPITKHDSSYGVLDGYVLPGHRFNNTVYMCPAIFNTDHAEHVFWHEYRHVLHQREGLFSFYYNLKWNDVKDTVKQDPVRWLDMCLEAENDCDAYAEKKTGKPVEDVYPASGVWLYNHAIKCMKKKIKAGLLTLEDCKKYLQECPKTGKIVKIN